MKLELSSENFLSRNSCLCIHVARDGDSDVSIIVASLEKLGLGQILVNECALRFTPIKAYKVTCSSDAHTESSAPSAPLLKSHQPRPRDSLSLFNP